MNLLHFTTVSTAFLLLSCSNMDSQSLRLQSLDAYWLEVSRSVNQGDFEAYSATTHPDGVLVNGIHQKAVPLTKALQNWEKNFINTKSGQMQAAVEFRFSRRLGDDSAAHESGIFKYTEIKSGVTTTEYIVFEALLTKKSGQWLMLMEYQKATTSQAEWDILPSKTQKK